MILLKNTKNHFGITSILLHWLMAFLLILIFILGIYMTQISISPLQLKLFREHKELGMLGLMLVFLRIGWRFSNLVPSLAALARWESIAAYSVHWIFYGFMFALPITGWILSSAAGIPVAFFGLWVFPDLVTPNEELRI